MPNVSATQVAFVAYNAAVGLLVGWAAARSPGFERLGIPAYAWLVAGMLAFEVLAGLVLKAHPAAIISMPLRLAGLVAAFSVCYATLGVLKPA